MQLQSRTRALDQLRVEAAATKTRLSDELSRCQRELESTRLQLAANQQRLTSLETELRQRTTQLDTAADDTLLEVAQIDFSITASCHIKCK